MLAHCAEAAGCPSQGEPGAHRASWTLPQAQDPPASASPAMAVSSGLRLPAPHSSAPNNLSLRWDQKNTAQWTILKTNYLFSIFLKREREGSRLISSTEKPTKQQQQNNIQTKPWQKMRWRKARTSKAHAHCLGLSLPLPNTTHVTWMLSENKV